MRRPKRLYPLGRYCLHIRGEIDSAKQYLVQLEYTWNRQVIYGAIMLPPYYQNFFTVFIITVQRKRMISQIANYYVLFVLAYNFI